MKKITHNKQKIFIFLFIIFCSVNAQSNILFNDSVKNKMKQVANWQIQNFEYAATGSSGYLHDYGIDAWTNAVLYLGLIDWAKISDDKESYYRWLYKIGEETGWNLPENFISYPKYSLYHADELCIGQFYLEMGNKYKDLSLIQPTRDRIEWIMEHPADTTLSAANKQIWSWCDALFMAPPVYAHLSVIYQDPKYLEYMDKEFKITYNYLYDKDEHLFFRDASYFDKRETNGEKVFWGRGNAWVIAGIANILKYIPQNSNYRTFYEDLFKEHLTRLLVLRDKDGFWHASLLDPVAYPSPETSATALITYAMAYGINNNLLDKAVFLPLVEKSWEALTSVINDQGKLGFVQPIGADPKKVTEDMTAVYGVGAFLMAGYEIFILTNK